MNQHRAIIAVVAGVALTVPASLATATSDTTNPPTDNQQAPASTLNSDGTSGTEVPVIDPGDGGSYAPSIDPAEFVDVVDNPYFPLSPGSRWVYEGESDGDARTHRGRSARRAARHHGHLRGRRTRHRLRRRRDRRGHLRLVCPRHRRQRVVPRRGNPGLRRRRSERRRLVGVRRRWSTPRNRHAGQSHRRRRLPAGVLRRRGRGHGRGHRSRQRP